MKENYQHNEVFSFDVVWETAIIKLKSRAFQVLLDLPLKKAFLDCLITISEKKGIKGLIIFDSPECHDYENYIEFARAAFSRESINTLTEMELSRFGNAGRQITMELLKFTKPIIVGIQGRVPIENFGYYLPCDYRIAAENMQIEFPDLNLGIPPGAASYFISKEIGPNKTLEMYLTGKTLSASEARKLNIINEIVPSDDLYNACEERLDQLFMLTSNSLVAMKPLIKPDLPEIESHLEHSWDVFWSATPPRE